MLANSQFSYLPYDDYAQSANTLFHFMTKPEYLDSVLRRRAIIPRYCVETIYIQITDFVAGCTALVYRMDFDQCIFSFVKQAIYTGNKKS